MSGSSTAAGIAELVSTKSVLTTPQTALWLPQIMFPGKPVANTGWAVTIEGALDPRLFAEAIRRLVAETDALRLSLSIDGDTVYQQVRDYTDYAIQHVDVSSVADPDEAARQWIEKQYWLAVDWTGFPLFRFALIKLSVDRHIWFQVHNHVIIDAIGKFLVVERVAQVYRALRDGVPVTPNDAISYLARVEWEQSYLRSDAYLDDQRYWIARLSPPPDPLVEGDRRRTECALTGRSLQISQAIGRAEFERLRVFAKSLDSSLPRLLLALIAIAFFRLTGNRDLVLGVALHNRIEEKFKRTIGLFSTNLPLRIDIDRDMALRDALRRMDTDFVRDRSHIRFPVERLGGVLGLSRQQRGLYDVLVNYLPAGSQRDFAGLPIAINRLQTGMMLPWDVTVRERGASGGAVLDVDYDAGLIDADEARRFAHCLAFLMTNSIDNIDRSIGSLPIISDEERQRFVKGVNQTAENLPQDVTLASLCADQAVRTPRDIAVVWGTEAIDYATLHARASELARRLIGMGVSLDSVVGIALPRSIELLVAVLAVHKAGGAYLPLDPAYPAERIAYMVGDARAAVIVTTSALAARLPSKAARLLLINRSEREPTPDGQSGDTGELPYRAGLGPDRLAYVIYTSGSTGRPKGVGVTHRNAVNLVLCARTLVDPEDLKGMLFATSLNFDLSVYEIFLALAFGGRLILVENLLEVTTAPRRDEVRLINTGPSLIDALLKAGDLPAQTRTINLCGEPLLRPLADRIFAAAPAVRLINFYGPTETTVYSTWASVDAKDRRAPAIGRGLWNTQLYVLDADRELLPAGAKGELYIGGEGVARGYLNRPDFTEERFIANPFGDGRLFRTGDLVRWRPDGELEFLGRADTQIKINGLRIELGEIEAHLDTVPGITGAAVVVRPDKFGVNRLYSYATSQDGTARPGFDQIRACLARSLPSHMMPSAHIWLEAFPLTPNQKLDRRALPLPLDAAPVREGMAPRTDAEQRLARIWQQLLKMEEIGVRDDFFELGGDSLMAVGLLLEIERQLGRRLPFDAVYGDVTIERLAEYLGSAGSEEPADVVVPLQRLGSKKPFFCVHGIGGEVLNYGLLARHMGTERPFFGIKAPDLRVAKDILSTIEATARFYVEAILARQPVGPYFIGGVSLGATIAYEIALQLARRGHRVGLLALIDQRRKGWTLEFSNVVPTAVNFLRNIAPWLRHDFAYHGVGEVRKNILRKLTVWLRRLSRGGKRSPEPDISVILDLSRYAPDRHDLFRVLYAALLAYRPKNYRGRVVVFRAAAQPIFRLWDEPGLGWRELVEPEPDVRVVPGNHRTMTAEPYVSSLATQLRQCLDQADTACNRHH